MLGNYIRIQPPGSWPLFWFSTALWHLTNGKCDGGIALVWWFPVREKIQSNYLETSESVSTRKLRHLSWWIAWGPQPGRTWNIKPGSVCFHRRQPWALATKKSHNKQKWSLFCKEESGVYLKKGCMLRRKTKRKGQVSVDQSEDGCVISLQPCPDGTGVPEGSHWDIKVIPRKTLKNFNRTKPSQMIEN